MRLSASLFWVNYKKITSSILILSTVALTLTLHSQPVFAQGFLDQMRKDLKKSKTINPAVTEWKQTKEFPSPECTVQTDELYSW